MNFQIFCHSGHHPLNAIWWWCLALNLALHIIHVQRNTMEAYLSWSGYYSAESNHLGFFALWLLNQLHQSHISTVDFRNLTLNVVLVISAYYIWTDCEHLLYSRFCCFSHQPALLNVYHYIFDKQVFYVYLLTTFEISWDQRLYLYMVDTTCLFLERIE